MSASSIKEYGFSPVPRDLDRLLQRADPKKDPPSRFKVDEIVPKGRCAHDSFP